MRFARHIQRTTLAIGLALSLTSCVDESACEACIDDQTELRTELIELGLEPAGSLESTAYYRGACTQKVIALDRPCAPKYGRAIGAALLVLALGIGGMARRVRRRQTSR
jgi:hypothetical protein